MCPPRSVVCDGTWFSLVYHHVVVFEVSPLIVFLCIHERRFGFANAEALAAGQTGTACRGEEHDITLVWSLTSGKRLVLADGQEVHFSNSRSNIFDYTWTMKGHQVLKIVAHSAPPLTPTPGFRQYDFFVNGQSFFSFPKVFRLGLTSPNDPRGAASPSSGSAFLQAESTRNRYSGNAGGVAGPRRSSSNIASLEAPGNPDEVRILYIFNFHFNSTTNISWHRPL